MRKLFEDIQSYKNQWSAVWEKQVGDWEEGAHTDWSPKESDRLENDCYTTEQTASPPKSGCYAAESVHERIKNQATPSKSLGPSTKSEHASNSNPADGSQCDELQLTDDQRKELQTVLLGIQALELSATKKWKPQL